MSDSEVKSRVLKMEQMEPNVQQVCERVSSSMSVGKARPASPTTDFKKKKKFFLFCFCCWKDLFVFLLQSTNYEEVLEDFLQQCLIEASCVN